MAEVRSSLSGKVLSSACRPTIKRFHPEYKCNTFTVSTKAPMIVHRQQSLALSSPLTRLQPLIKQSLMRQPSVHMLMSGETSAQGLNGSLVLAVCVRKLEYT
eukprot:scaffold297471_cov18-Prasinocladus_malaysianus.AAC.1